MTETIIVEQASGTACITLNRPKQLNALSERLAQDMIGALIDLDKNPDVRCIVVTGSERAFAAGADIAEMQSKSYAEMADQDYFSIWDTFSKIRTPKIAAVRGYALGGGCELAMMCDFIIAGESAKFGLPELKLGVIPGIGGTQRLSRLVGRAKAMDMTLTARTIDAAEALDCGLVARVLPDDDVISASMDAAATIAGFSAPAVRLAREAVHRVDENNLSEGLLFERRVFHSLFATEDQKEGMSAFLEKRPPNFSGK